MAIFCRTLNAFRDLSCQGGGHREVLSSTVTCSRKHYTDRRVENRWEQSGGNCSSLGKRLREEEELEILGNCQLLYFEGNADNIC
jgi:hypothetical protein